MGSAFDGKFNVAVLGAAGKCFDVCVISCFTFVRWYWTTFVIIIEQFTFNWYSEFV